MPQSGVGISLLSVLSLAKMSKKYRRFTYFFLGITLSPVLAIGLFNGFVDPYEIFNSPKISGFNQLKPAKFTNDRLFKAIEITHIKPKIILLGSSRTQWGLDPKHPAFDEPSYNLALQGANMYETMRYFQHAIANQSQLKTVVVGIDFFMFAESPNKLIFKESRLEKKSMTFEDAISVLFSLDALATSQDTIAENRTERETHEFIDGLLLVDPRKTLPGSIEEFTKFIVRGFQDDSQASISQKQIDSLKILVKQCQEQGIQLELLISPAHAIQWEANRLNEGWETFEQWKREVVKIAPVWDFSGYNSITTEPIQNQMKNYIDSSHYRKEVGDLILNRIFNYQVETVPDDFGVLLTPDNIEAHLEKIRRDREIWVKNNPEAIELLDDIKREMEAEEKN
jgi:hypothetical protein